MKFRVLKDEEAIAIAQIFKDLEDDMLDFVLDEIKYLASCSRTMRKIDEVSKRAEEKLRRLKPKLKFKIRALELRVDQMGSEKVRWSDLEVEEEDCY